MANTKITTNVIADNAVGITQLNVSDGSDGQALVTNGSGTLSFASVGVSGISSSADATAITIDSSEDVTFAGAVTSTGKITADAGIDIDNINIDGTTIIAKKLNKKINYKRSGIIGFEIFYIKYLTFYIANIMHFFLLLKIKIRNILKNTILNTF